MNIAINPRRFVDSEEGTHKGRPYTGSEAMPISERIRCASGVRVGAVPCARPCLVPALVNDAPMFVPCARPNE